MSETLTPEQFVEKVTASFDSKISALETKLKSERDADLAALRADLAQRSAVAIVPGIGDKEIKDYSVNRLIRGAMAARRGGDAAMKAVAPHEYDMHVAALAVQKDLATSVDASGGYLVPAQVMQAQMIPLLREQLILTALGITNLNGLTGSPVEIPKVTGGTTAYMVNHDTTTSPTAVTKSGPTFGQMRLQPHTVAARAVLSNRLVSLSSPDADALVSNEIMKDMALKIESQAFNGIGSAGEVTGLLQTSGIGADVTVGSVAAATFYNKGIDMIAALRTAKKSLTGNIKWLMDVPIWASMMKTVDPSDQPKARRLLTEAPPEYLLGYKYFATGNVPANTLVLGAWEDMILGTWGGMVVKVDDLSVNGLLQTQVLASSEFDVQIRRGESFQVGQSVAV